ncbi:MAG: glycosyltransferase family 39 protein [Candidatus Pacebacteria bacterium]|nr:glycosyltransferase family 39 protein [Candidatus Paceibacterota bacterium]
MKLQIKTILNGIKNFIIKRKEFFVIVLLLLISGIAHGYNMFNFPYYENDEGTYISQAWSVLNQGTLSHYTYWYDHSPVGWFLIALWTKLTGGFFTFGMSVNSGRVLMLVLHLFSTFFLFKIAKKMTGSIYAGFFSALIFALSPLGIYFQRRVLLDNIMVFWLLMSLHLILCFKKRLLIIIFSAITFSLSVLSKESGIFFLPVMLYLVFIQTNKQHKRLGFVLWIILFGLICSLYPLYALLKSELFPMGSIFDAGGEHVSLIETLTWQIKRDGENTIQYLKQWFYDDKFVIIFGTVTTFINLLLGISKKYYRIAALLSFSYIFYLTKGGLLIGFYIVGLMPFLALNIGMFLQFLLDRINKKKLKCSVFLFLFIILSSVLIKGLADEQKIYIDNQIIDQKKALTWIKENITNDKVIVITNYSYVDLKSGYVNIFPYKNVQWYWKIDKDPEIKHLVLYNQWSNIDYIIITPQMIYDMDVNDDLILLKTAFAYSEEVKRFNDSDYSIVIYKIDKEMGILQESWQNYKTHFIISEGKVVDSHSNNSTTSEGQSYALLRAVWMDDKETFDEVLDWTNENLKLKNSNLFAWSWIQDNNGNWRTRDKGAATDADQDIALALLFASKKWDNPMYLEQAKKIINDIWNYEVVEVKGKHYLTAGNWTSSKEDIVINPSYLAPYAYRIFAEVDPSHNWIELVDTSYDILYNSSESALGYSRSVGLPPNWCAINPDGKIISAKHLGDFSQDYSYDAIRTPWRIALDYQWNKEPRAKKYLESLKFLNKEWIEKKRISASYSHDGKHWENYESTASYGANLGYFIVVHPETSKEIYEEKVLGKYFEDEEKSYWNDPENYYEQNWGWFGTALYADKLPNLWNQ